jgi:hypothetical protein
MRSALRTFVLAALAGALLIGPIVQGAGAAPAEDPEVAGRAVDKVAAQFDGLAVGYEGDTGTYVLRLPLGSPNLAAAQRSLSDLNIPSRVMISSLTSDKVNEIQSSIARVSQAAESKGFFYGSAYDPIIDKVNLKSNSDNSTVASLLTLYGDSLSFAKVANGGRMTRTSDGSPHHGGASIEDSAVTHYCSSGITVIRSNGTRGITTAGHCWNGTAGTAIFDESGTHQFGNLIGRAGYPGFDQDLITGSTYSRDIYTGGSTGVTIPVISADDPVVGGSYCHSGRTTFEHCGEVPWSLNAQFCDIDGCTTSLIAYNGTDLQPGDSGAPFYAKFATPAAKIRGMAIAIVGPDNYAERWLRIASHLNVTIATS